MLCTTITYVQGAADEVILYVHYEEGVHRPNNLSINWRKLWNFYFPKNSNFSSRKICELTVFIHWFQQNWNSLRSIKPSWFLSKTANICFNWSSGTTYIWPLSFRNRARHINVNSVKDSKSSLEKQQQQWRKKQIVCKSLEIPFTPLNGIQALDTVQNFDQKCNGLFLEILKSLITTIAPGRNYKRFRTQLKMSKRSNRIIANENTIMCIGLWKQNLCSLANALLTYFFLLSLVFFTSMTLATIVCLQRVGKPCRLWHFEFQPLVKIGHKLGQHLAQENCDKNLNRTKFDVDEKNWSIN